jgi:hypothetical protein
VAPPIGDMGEQRQRACMARVRSGGGHAWLDLNRVWGAGPRGGGG